MSVPRGIIVGYLRGVSDSVLRRVVKRRRWWMAHGGGSAGICRRWSGDECWQCVGTCGYKLPLCNDDAPGGIACLNFGAIFGTDEVQLAHKAIAMGVRWMWVYNYLSNVGEGNGVNDRSKGRYRCIVITVVSTYPLLNSLCSVHF